MDSGVQSKRAILVREAPSERKGNKVYAQCKIERREDLRRKDEPMNVLEQAVATA